MNRIQLAILPAFLLSSLLIVLLTQWITNPRMTAHAFSGEPESMQPAPETQTDVAEPSTTTDTLTETESAAVTDTAAACSLGVNFPDSIRRWCALIETHAREHSLDPNLIAAVILQESGGKPDAYSKSGAVGLMQVMPRDGIAATFQCINGPCFSSRPTIEELSDPDYNVAFGTKMLAGLIRKHGSVREALRAYGPMDVGYYYADLVLDIYNTYR